MKAPAVTAHAKETLTAVLAGGGEQNFLDAPWVPVLLDLAPVRLRRALALRVLSLSPHYFYAPDVETESARNRRSREQIAEHILAPYLRPDMSVMDYGCGPGYLAHAVAERVRLVEAVDISRGALKCAQILNDAPNINYRTPQMTTAHVDLAYSIAVVQHLTDEVFASALDFLHGVMRPGGTLLLQVVVDAVGWRTEAEWRSDTTITGRLRLRHGLNCFTRSEASLRSAVERGGFDDIRIESLGGWNWLGDDIADGDLLIARRR